MKYKKCKIFIWGIYSLVFQVLTKKEEKKRSLDIHIADIDV